MKKIELNARHAKLRLALALLLLAVGIGAFGYGLFHRSAPDAGWAQIEAAPSNVPSCSGDFIFLYPLGATASPAAEQRTLAALYTDACEAAYRLFTNDVEFAGLANVRYLNAHPNEEVPLDPALYRAFEQIAASGDRSLYLAPIREVYDNIFTCADPAQTAEFDPRQNEELRSWFADVCARINDPAQVNVELLGGDRAVLRASDEYLAWARSEEIESFIDFNWMKNAFIADYLAGQLSDAGYAMGTLSSVDGFMRNLDTTDSAEYALSILDRDGDTVLPAATLRYRGARAIVALRDFPASAADASRYAPLPDGSFATPYLDAADGLCKCSVPSLTAYSETAGCAEILLQLIPVYIADSLDPSTLSTLASSGIQSVYCAEGAICYTEEGIGLSDVAKGCSVRLLEP